MERNAILIPHGSFVEYLSLASPPPSNTEYLSEKTNLLEVKLVGNFQIRCSGEETNQAG